MTDDTRATTSWTTEQKLEAVRREIGYREHVYERRVRASRMSRRKADHELGVMRAIEADYTRQLEKERLL